ncbi:MAG: type III pantothenate kinase, partial [Coriobacteriales bacterium]
DIGNTQTAIGIYDGDDMRAFWRVASDKEATSDQVLIQLHELVELETGLEDSVDEAVVASVVPVLTQSWRIALHRFLGHDPRIVDYSVAHGLNIKYRNPREIGPDRIADAVGAIDKFGCPVIVVDLGTATNIEVIDDEGAFLGGVIAPGLSVSANALFESAARLAQVDLVAPPKVIGQSTIEAVQSGLLYGEVARIDGLVKMIKLETGLDATVVATGGLHRLISPISSAIDYCDDFLTLEGLKIINTRMRAAEGEQD